MYSLIIIFLQFISGSIMYSYILAKLSGVDLKNYRDGNPGSSNLWRIKGWKFGLPAMILDFFKGLFPIILFNNIDNVTLNIALIAGIAGHAFSPWLNFKGGKSIATTFGAWTLATKGYGAIIMGSVLVLLKKTFNKEKSPEKDFIIFIIGYLTLIPYLFIKKDLYLLYIGNLIILLYKHKTEIKSILLEG
ncbi:glycerol-3-phosphate acyltransferase [Marinitoga litoralis]|uniref:glycerol-3-phosphate acyltransferase n=1 Tax=Marinitoga litoralis TaxID=570855 RepID=UPI0019606879|nr:glycerol-3-phosphate acyltransferase [Marinitoga litoralis]MBM7559578.1 acyl-phosphate glycerol 3-phosphate acyltransferase [Marinitoga litoralis]